jgi:hypothetical protein
LAIILTPSNEVNLPSPCQAATAELSNPSRAISQASAFLFPNAPPMSNVSATGFPFLTLPFDSVPRQPLGHATVNALPSASP